jgi:hypothetical protein
MVITEYSKSSCEIRCDFPKIHMSTKDAAIGFSRGLHMVIVQGIIVRKNKESEERGKLPA